MTTTQNAELVDINCLPLAAVLKTVYEKIKFKASSLGGLKKADKEILTKMTDLDVDLSDADVNSQNIDEALMMLKNCPQLNSLKLKMPELKF